MSTAALDLDLARLSAAVYEVPWSAAAGAVAATGWTLVDPPYDHGDAQAMLCRRQDAPLEALVFRGTEATRLRVSDVLSNTGLPGRWAGPGRAHSGYAAHLSRIMLPALQRYSQTDMPTLVTGHSLGGALATLFAAYLCWQDDRPPAALVTFGSPKALDAAGAGQVTCPTRRYEIRGDFAPWWPPSLLLRHPAPATWLPGRQWWHGPLRRHSIDAYVDALGRGMEPERTRPGPEAPLRGADVSPP